jgi:hypothetical protein
MALSTTKYAKSYINKGMAVVPVPANNKRPVLSGWQILRIGLEEIPHYFNSKPQNIGVLLGEPSGWLVDVDLDVPEAVSCAPYFLPKSLKSGRESSLGSHWWYRSEGASTEKFKDADGATLLELRSTGCQTVVEPSVHPEGDRYLWEGGTREIAEAAPKELLRRCKLLATATVVARALPPVGGRHDFALALAGFLLRDERLAEGDALRVMEAAWSAAGGVSREAEQDLAGIVRDTARNLLSGAEVVGGRRLEELSPGLPQVLGRWWGWGSQPRCAEHEESARPAQGGTKVAKKAARPETYEGAYRSLREAVPFPVDALPRGCQRFVMEGSEAIGCPPDLLALPVLATLSAGIGASRVVEIKRGWTEGASLFLGVVAPPGAKKTPAAKAATEPVRERQGRLQREHRKKMEVYDQEMREWEVDKKLSYKDDKPAPRQPEKPSMERVIADDTTVEALVGILEDNPRGVLVDKDELTGWVRAMDQYKGGKGADRQHWLSIWSSKPVVVDRKSRAGEPVILTRPWVSLLGGIQPSMLKELGAAREDGLLDRFLFAYPAPRRTQLSRAEISPEGEREYSELYRKLADLKMVEDEYGDLNPGVVRMSQDAWHLFKQHADTLNAEAFDPGFPARLQGVWSKLEGYLARLSLILALARRMGNGEIERVQAEDVEAAGRLIDYFKAHVKRVYAVLKAATPQELLAGELKEFLEEHEGEWTGSATELYEALEEREAKGLPENADWLTRMVLEIADQTESLEAKKESNRAPEFFSYG